MSAPAAAGAEMPAPSDAAVALAAVLDHAAATPLARTLMAVRGGDLEVDASRVGHLGAQCAQVLLASRRTWAAEARSFRIVRPSDEFVEGLRLLGLSIELGE